MIVISEVGVGIEGGHTEVKHMRTVVSEKYKHLNRKNAHTYLCRECEECYYCSRYRNRRTCTRM
jgi:hypothetical protein